MDFKSILLAQKTGYIPRNHFDALFAKRIGGAVLKDFPGLPSSIVTVTDALAKPLDSLKVAITPIQSGSGDPSPDNIRPISGWTEANVYNDIYPPIYWNQLASLLSANWYKNRGTFTSSGNDIIFTNSYNSGLKYFNKSIKKGHIFYIGTPGITISNSKVYIEIYDGSGTTRTTLATISTNERTPFYIIFKDGTGYNDSRFGFTRPTDSPNGSTLTIENLQIYDLTVMFGEERAEEIRRMADGVNYIKTLFPKNYYAYNTGEKTTVGAVNGNTSGIYNVNWESEAGTVYGGTLDVVNGTLTVTKANIASYDGETLPGVWISDRDVYAEGTTPTTGAQVVYDLDTPITYQLTPTEVQMLLGTNNIWADTGDILEGKYYGKRSSATRAMLNTLRDAGEITRITPEETEEEKPEENADER